MNTEEICAKLLAAEYAPKTSRKLIALKKLDRRAKRPAVMCAYSLGIAGIMIFSAGICLLTLCFIKITAMRLCIGTLLFIIGLLALTCNCALFQKIFKKVKQRYAFEIVELAKEICEYDI